MKNAIVTVCLALAALASGACDDAEPFFKTCPLSTTIWDVCQDQATDTELTCIVREHPMCDEQVCASWQGSGTFCSRECTADTDCPTESTCKSHLDFKICVPNTLPTAPPVLTTTGE